jgi:hypothetical protein
VQCTKAKALRQELRQF